MARFNHRVKGDIFSRATGGADAIERYYCPLIIFFLGETLLVWFADQRVGCAERYGSAGADLRRGRWHRAASIASVPVRALERPCSTELALLVETRPLGTAIGLLAPSAYRLRA